MAVPGTGTEAVMGQPALSLKEGKSCALTSFLSGAAAGQDRVSGCDHRAPHTRRRSVLPSSNFQLSAYNNLLLAHGKKVKNEEEMDICFTATANWKHTGHVVNVDTH